MSEPIEDRGQLDEAKEGGCEFVVAGADAAVALDSAEEVFDVMAATVIAAVKGDWRSKNNIITKDT